ncbi:hypothetical protein CXB51_007179 [Gossypium anomalum]|uniref:Integrase catalytic domain-containing protein n=1 Tax=Gossypium anomalum TaxID=47600 RepID=A0A8J5YXC8_9ROSI|nr:hypothetical protein CXB51_007179 [Gossypium anomalum]
MATVHSVDSESTEPNGSVFTGDRVRFILTGYGLFGFLDGSLTAPTKFVQSFDGMLSVNPSSSVFEQQDNLLMSWLLSTISSSFLSSFTDVRTACDVWLVATSLFAADTSAKQSQLRHELHSLKKGTLSIRSYVDKIKGLCALLAASGSQISEAEQTAILLAGLSSEYDAVVSFVSLSSESLPFQRVVDALLECEARQKRTVQDVLIAANLVEGSQSPVVDGSSRGGRSSFHGRGREFRPQIQCQICSRFGHLAQKCYYRYSRDEQSPPEDPLAQQGVSTFGGSRFPTGNGQNWNGNGGNGQNWQANGTGQSWNGPGQNWQANFNGQNWNGNSQNWQAHGQNWNGNGGNGQNWGNFSPGYSRPNVGIPNVGPRGPTLFVPNGGRPSNNGFHATIGPQILDQQIGNIGGPSTKAYGPPDAGQALECFLQFQKLVFTQFGKHIKKFQSDWGGEFRAFASVLASQGILHRLSCPHTSEQNGVAERKHRHVVETGLTLLAQANLPMVYWGYAFCSAVHLINRLPTPVLEGRSPYQALYRTEPTYHHLRVFGCCCFPFLRPFLKHKLEFRSQPCTFLGYSSQHKGYYCLTPDGKVVVSRHVVFDESRFIFSASPAISSDTNGSTLSDFVSTHVPVVRSSVSQSCAAHPPGPPPIQHSLTPSPSIPVDSPSVAVAEPPEISAPPLVNIHRMVTRSKADIFKPKVLHVEADDFEPRTVEDALAHPEWKLAVQAEFDALSANSTWTLVPLPPGRKIIGCKWLFKVKRHPDGTIDHRKARLVAKGCSQAPGCDFKETFSPVVKPATIRLILSVAVSKGWTLRQVDVNNAFLNGDLKDEVFMQQPPGYVQIGPHGERLVCRLTKALYGLRQAPRAWFDKLKGFLLSTGFTLSKSDASLFVRVMTTSTLYVLVYVDDIIVTGNLPDSIDVFVRQLHCEFSLKDMGDLHYFLGIEVTRTSVGSLHLCQRKYIRDLLERSGLANAKHVNTPMVSSSVLSEDDGDRLSDPTEYRSLAGALQYIVLTRSDIAYAMNRVCQFMHSPTSEHLVALKRILRYLCGTISYGLVFRSSDRLSLVGYADANWGLDVDDRRSTTGYCVFYGQTPVSWSSKKQQIVSRSTAEAEYRSLTAAASDVTWLLSLLHELHLSSIDVPALWCDNSSAVAVAANPVLHSKFKHVELDLFFVREKVADGLFVVGEVPACDQVADVLTKPLSVSSFVRFRNFLRVFPVEKMGA